MPLNRDIKKVLVIGSGPIVIGQAAEFDYAGTQACRVLKDEGVEIVLINSNPATIMTDKNIADKIYIEPLTLPTVKRIIEKERPDSILSGLGGQTGLTLCMQLAKDGFLEHMNVRLLGSSPLTIDKAEDRLIFKETMQKIHQPVIPSVIANDIETALGFAATSGYPLIIRPAFTLGGSGGGIADNEQQLVEIATNGLALSPINQVLVEKSIAGWKEIEFEVMRDGAGNTITVCSMENFDPVGVHTGDSIVIAPTVTLSDKEYQMLRTAAMDIIDELDVMGGCNCQFALHPDSFEYAVIEVNPRVSRSSALASKATGYPIAKVATKIALGYNLDEIVNAVTGTTYAAFEPALDYVAVKFPKWPFDKFVYAKKELGTQMKATGEVMAIADSFEMALLKAVRGAEIGLSSLSLPRLAAKSTQSIKERLHGVTDQRLFYVYEAICRGISIDEIFDITRIDRWFLHCLKNIADGYDTKGELSYKMVDTCAGEFEAQTPYFYSTVNSVENEAEPFVARSQKDRIVVLGSGPIRIGQGIEFDYACVHCVWSLKNLGYEVIVINNNPETVSTDFDTADRLYFEPLCIDDVMSIIELEKPIGVIVSFGGGTAIKLTGELQKRGVNIIGTSADSIDACEDRERFDALLEDLSILRPKGSCVMSADEAIKAANELGYPVLLRPSYVLGGQNMIIAFTPDDVEEYMRIILSQKQENPILIDKYLSGREIEVDAICDGTDVLIPGIIEHVERTGVHSGDSIAVYPPVNVDDNLSRELYDMTKRLCLSLKVLGLVNIQYVLHEGEVYVIEINPRASRTVPYISKVTGVPMCDVATRVSIGQTLKQLGYTDPIAKIPPYFAVKVPVFSFEKLTDLDTHLGPEMKSTGEVLGIGRNLKEALYKGLVAAGYSMKKVGGVFITVRDNDKTEICRVAKEFEKQGFDIYATQGTARELKAYGVAVHAVDKIHVSEFNNTMTLLESGKISYIISTSEGGRDPATDEVKMRRKACQLGIPCLTSLDTAAALADSLSSGHTEYNTEIIDINNLREVRMQLNFTKMHGCGNDYIYLNCFDNAATGGLPLTSPESLSVFIADRHFGVGGDGVVLILPSDVADAKMRMFNLDGSEGKMCGNAIRCVAKYLYDSGMVENTLMTIDTLSGIKTLSLNTQNGKVFTVKVDMGAAEFDPKNIPVKVSGDEAINTEIALDDRTYKATCVSMGNPHAVIFDWGDVPLDILDIETPGVAIENHPLFPEKVNVEFAEVVSENRIKMRVWERGSGETLACGTGACAVVSAAVKLGLCERNTDVTVELLGGELVIHYTDETVFMTGDCKKVFEGVVEV